MAVKRGRLEPLRLFKVFRGLLERRMSGVITLRRGQVVKQAQIDRGDVARTASNVPSEGLLWVLVEEGLISSTEKLQLEAEAGGLEITQRLIDEGLVAATRLASLQRRLSRRRLVEAFGWPEGEFEYLEQPVHPAAEGEGVEGGALLVEAGARALPDPVCERFVALYPNQFVFAQPAIQPLAPLYDRYFPPPNARSRLARPMRFDEIVASGLADRAARQVFALVVSGMAGFRTAEQLRAELLARQQRQAAAPVVPQGAAPAVQDPWQSMRQPGAAPAAVRHPNPSAGAQTAVRHPNPPTGTQAAVRHPNPPTGSQAAVRHPNPPTGSQAAVRHPNPPTGSQAAVRPPTPAPSAPPPAQRPAARITGSQRAFPSTGGHRAVTEVAASGPPVPMRGQGRRPASANPTPVPMRGQALRPDARATPPPAPARAPSGPARPAASSRPRDGRATPPAAGGARPAAPRPKAGSARRPASAPKAAVAMPDKVRLRLEKARELGSRLDAANHYELLGVSRTASPDAVRQAFRGLARELHADVFARFDLSDADRQLVQRVFIAVNKANETLGDPAKRAEYDLGLERGGGAAGPAGAGLQVDQVFRAEKLVRDGLLLIRNNQGAAAKDKLDEALGITPDDPLAQAGQAFADYLVVQARGSAPQMAARTREKLEAITADYAVREEPFVYLGRIYRALEQPDRAIAAFKAALNINPHCAEASSELRFLQRHQEDGKSKGLFGRKKK